MRQLISRHSALYITNCDADDSSSIGIIYHDWRSEGLRQHNYVARSAHAGNRLVMRPCHQKEKFKKKIGIEKEMKLATYAANVEGSH